MEEGMSGVEDRLALGVRGGEDLTPVDSGDCGENSVHPFRTLAQHAAPENWTGNVCFISIFGAETSQDHGMINTP